LDDDVRERLLNPLQSILDIDDPNIHFSIHIYLSLTEALEDCYKATRRAIADCFGDSVNMLSYYDIQKLVGELSGVYPVVYDMCERSCMAYTGPYADFDWCLYCDHARWDLKKTKGGKLVPYKTFSTFPIGPQLQVLWCSLKSAKAMQ
ncbi:hypothetical protein NEOLEDRAFT_1075402, partial [Neolentinus lepideus HHB14362 ss-1]